MLGVLKYLRVILGSVPWVGNTRSGMEWGTLRKYGAPHSYSIRQSPPAGTLGRYLSNRSSRWLTFQIRQPYRSGHILYRQPAPPWPCISLQSHLVYSGARLGRPTRQLRDGWFIQLVNCPAKFMNSFPSPECRHAPSPVQSLHVCSG